MFRVFGLAAVVTMLCASAGAFQVDSRPPNLAPVPDVPALLTEVQKNQKAIESLVEQYACQKKVEELEPTKGTGFRSKPVKEYEVFYLGGAEVDRLVARDGKPLPPDEQQKETARVEKEVRKFERKQEKHVEREAEGKKKEEEHGISVFLRVERLTNPRRVELRGHSVVAFDFASNPNYHPKTIVERVIQKLVGTAWVDDDAKQVVRLEAHFGGSLKIGGGLLAKIQEGSAVVFEQALVNNEVWLPSYGEIHIRARELFRGVRLDQIIHYSEYKKFRVETVTKPARGKAKSE
jgi:hypothetical protein